MNIKILTKYSGLGNQVWFIPAIKELKEQRHYVFTDSLLLNEMIGLSYEYVVGCSQIERTKPDRIYVPLHPNYKDFMKIKLQNPSTDIYGFKYRIKGIDIGLGYKESVRVDEGVHELNTIAKLIPNDQPFGAEPIYPPVNEKKVVLGTSNKPKCSYVYWDTFRKTLEYMGFEVSVLGESGKMHETYGNLLDDIISAKYFIGVDSGLMHIADYYKKKGIVFWNRSSCAKNRPIHLKIDFRQRVMPTEWRLLSWLDL